MILPVLEQKNKLSNIKFMGLLQEPDPNEPQPPSTYWKPCDTDYSELMEKLRLQRMNK